MAVNNKILIVDDGSVDGTRDWLQQMDGKDQIRVLYHEKNQGKAHDEEVELFKVDRGAPEAVGSGTIKIGNAHSANKGHYTKKHPVEIL